MKKVKLLLIMTLCSLLSLSVFTYSIDIDSMDMNDDMDSMDINDDMDSMYKGDIKSNTSIYGDIVGDLNVLDGVKLLLGTNVETKYNIILGKLSKLILGVNSKIEGDIIADNAESVIIKTNGEILGKIKGNGKNIELGANVVLGGISGNFKEIKLGTNSEISYIDVIVNNLNLGVNNDIKDIKAVVKENLEMSTNSGIEKMRLYVYNDLSTKVNNDINGKLTVFGDFFMGTNGDANGNICVINKIKLGVNGSVVTSIKKGLFGSLYYIANIDYSDNSNELKELEVKSNEFDNNIESIVKNIRKSTNNMFYYKNKLSSNLKEQDIKLYNDYLSKYSYYKNKRQELINKGISYVNNTFDNLKKYIQQDTKPITIYERLRKIYIGVVKNADLSLITNICSNTVLGSTNSSYILNNEEIKIGDMIFDREVVIKGNLEKRVEEILKKKDEEKLLQIKSKFNKIMPRFAEKNKGKIVNAIVDINSLIDNVLLYE